MHLLRPVHPRIAPTAALRERDDTGIVFDAIDDPNTVTVVRVAPAVRAAWAEQFNLSPEFATPKRMAAAALRELGFNYVFDTDFAADLTIMEEGASFSNASRTKGLPLADVHLLLPGLGALSQVTSIPSRTEGFHLEIPPADVRRHGQDLLCREDRH